MTLALLGPGGAYQRLEDRPWPSFEVLQIGRSDSLIVDAGVRYTLSTPPV